MRNQMPDRQAYMLVLGAIVSALIVGSLIAVLVYGLLHALY